MAAGLKRSKSVSWAPDANLCQVRLFLSEDAPALSGLASQDHLQTKASWLLHSNGEGPIDSLPPGFEANHPEYQLKKEISQIPLIKWQCPCILAMNPEWLVVAGEESTEVELQERRQRGALEAIYPRTSSIPSNPLVSSESAICNYNDEDDTPLIPLIAVEEEESDPPCATSIPVETSTFGLPYTPTILTNPSTVPILPNLKHVSLQPQGSSATPSVPRSIQSTVTSEFAPRVEPDIVAAASAVVTAMVKSSDERSMIDPDLLIQILRDPKMIEKLVSEYGTSKTPALQPALPTVPSASLDLASALQPTSSINRTVAMAAHPPYATTFANQRPPQVDAWAIGERVTAVAVLSKDVNPSMHQHGVNDINYYKNLIQQHGGDKLETMNPNATPNRNCYPQNYTTGNELDRGIRELRKRENKPKIAKPCVYFSTPRGCKHGANCLYLHDATLAQQADGRGGKRIKFDREIRN